MNKSKTTIIMFHKRTAKIERVLRTKAWWPRIPDKDDVHEYTSVVGAQPDRAGPRTQYVVLLIINVTP